jgi:hypothetical protein
MSKLEHAGDSTTASPGRASACASATAAASESARTTGNTPASACSMRAAASPITTTARPAPGWPSTPASGW